MQQRTFSDFISDFGSYLVLPALLLLLWPSFILIFALIMQARGAYVLKPKHITIFIAAQIIWLILFFSITGIYIIRPLNLSP